MNALRSWFLTVAAALAVFAGSGAATAAPLFTSGAGDATDALANVSNGAYGTGAFVYNGFTITGTNPWNVTGLFTNNITDYSATSANWSIRSGVSAGNPGSVIASGTGAVTPVATGNTLFGLPESTFTISGLNVNLAPGTYWFNVTPVGQGGFLGFAAQSNTSGLGAIGTSAPAFFSDIDLAISFQPSTSQGAQFNRLSGGVLGVVIPEPATLLVFGLGASCFALVGRRARRKAAEQTAA